MWFGKDLRANDYRWWNNEWLDGVGWIDIIGIVDNIESVNGIKMVDSSRIDVIEVVDSMGW